MQTAMKFVSGYTGHVQGAQEDCGRSVVDYARWSDSAPPPRYLPYSRPSSVGHVDAMNVPCAAPPSPYQHLSAFHLPGNPLLHSHGKSLLNPNGNPYLLSTGNPFQYTTSPTLSSPYVQPTNMVSPGYSHLIQSSYPQPSYGVHLPLQQKPYEDCITMSRGGDAPQRSLAAPLGLLTLPPSAPPSFPTPHPARYAP